MLSEPAAIFVLYQRDLVLRSCCIFAALFIHCRGFGVTFLAACCFLPFPRLLCAV